MKKTILSIISLSGMLFVNSCSQDELVNGPVDGDFVNATFTLSTTDDLGTRAVGDLDGSGEYVDVVTCAVFDANDAEMIDLRQTVKVDDKKAKYSIRLAKGQSYRVAFFAYDQDANAYDVTDMKNIKIIQNQPSNIEARDAFTAYVDITSAETMNNYEKDVTLYRPFAQINLGIDDQELEDARKAGISISNTKVVIDGVYTSFSAFDNAVPTSAAIGKMEFALNVLPTSKLTVNSKEYNWLAMNYVLVGDAGVEKGLTDIEFVWSTEDGKTNNPTTHFVNIPAQRNYRTNIIGRLLTNPADFNITIDSKFEGDKNEEIVTVVSKKVTTADELQAAINAAGVGQTIITLDADIKTKEIRVNQAKDVEIYIDGQDHTLDAKVIVDGKNNWNGTEGLTLDNINFYYTGRAEEIIHCIKDGNAYSHNLIVKNCDFTGSNTTTAFRAEQAFDVKFFKCTATGLHSFCQTSSGHTFEFDQITSKCVRGLSLKSHNCKVSNSTIVANADKYGLRADTQANGDVLKIANCNITAFIPVAVRNSNKIAINAFEVRFEGTNTLTRQGGSEYDVAISNTQGEYDTVGQTLTAFADGVITLTGADASWSIFK